MDAKLLLLIILPEGVLFFQLLVVFSYHSWGQGIDARILPVTKYTDFIMESMHVKEPLHQLYNLRNRQGGRFVGSTLPLKPEGK